MNFKRLEKNWEGLAKKDPMWAILPNPQKKGRKWDNTAFFASGEYEIKIILSLLAKRNIQLPDRLLALDFGCGLGRLSRGLAARFHNVVGVDISPSMVAKAQKENKEFANISFIHNKKPDLSLFPNSDMSLVLSITTLQYIPQPSTTNYITEFIRVLKKGGVAMFQIPSDDLRDISMSQKITKCIRIKERLALIGLGTGFNMEIHTMLEEEVETVIESCGAVLIGKYYTNHTDPTYDGKLTTSFDKDPSTGFINTLYIVQKQ
jgi:ubiquinone/menaquinone biosynthesis C-methylase UbiE